MKTYKKVCIELTEEEKNTLVMAHSLLESLYLNNDSQEVVDEHIESQYVNLERLVSALEDIMDYLGSQYI